MKKNPSFFIVTPSFNQGLYIERTILSVINQEYSPKRYKVVDGGSYDSTIEILSKFSKVLSWISEPDDGQAHAVNKGWSEAREDILGWINSDDIYVEGALNQVAKIFRENDDIDFVYGRANHIDIADNFIEEYKSEEWCAKRLRQRCFICQPTVFIKRSVVEKIGALNEALELCMDYEYWLRLADAGCKGYFINTKLAESRLYKENKTLRDRVAVHKEIVRMLYSRYKQVNTSWLKALATVTIERKIKSIKNRAIIQSLSIIYSSILEIKYNKRVDLSFYWQSIIRAQNTLIK